jgi:hypothetical protein
MGKSLIILGLILVAAGSLLSYGGKLPLLGKLPGDIHIERENFSFFFPLGTCLLISLLASFLFWLFRR